MDAALGHAPDVVVGRVGRLLGEEQGDPLKHLQQNLSNEQHIKGEQKSILGRHKDSFLKKNLTTLSSNRKVDWRSRCDFDKQMVWESKISQTGKNC